VRVFLSYASEDRAVAQAVHLALHAQGHDVFFDREDLPPGEEYHVRIRHGIERAHLLVFLVSPAALDAGSYTLNELEIAQQTWKHPAGKLLPVMLRPVPLEALPPYLKSVTFLQPEGNVPAAVASAVHRVGVARRRRLLVRAAQGLVVASAVLAGVYVYWSNRGPAQVRTGKDGAAAVLIPAGTFTMGDDEAAPRRELHVSAFYLDRHEVTTARYDAFLKATGSLRPPDGYDDVGRAADGNLPVVGVDWHDAAAYCRWAGKRLPTEAEWEKAARGTDERDYPWGDDPPTPAHAAFARSAESAYRGGMTAVGSHPAGKSPYDVDDLAGNVSEWVADWYAEGFASSDVRDPQGPETGTGKVIRGGGWYDPPDRLMAAKRYFASPDQRSDDIGFRCAAD
jgi:formylglycine-generating enzyme required for sulfatase activity